MGDLVRDLRHAFRLLVSAPAVSVVAVLSLALGIGTNVALFSFANAIFFRPLPVRAPEELVGLYTTDPAFPGLIQSAYPNLSDLAASQTVFTGMAMTLGTPLNLTGGEAPERVSGELVSSDYFELLGVRAEQGRTFHPDEDKLNASPVIVLSHEFWRRKFGLDPRILGRVLKLNNRPYVVVGVIEPSFPGLNPFAPRDLWLPMGMRLQAAPTAMNGWFDTRETLMMESFARLKPGVSEGAARAALKTFAAALRQQFPKEIHARGMDLAPLTSMNPNARGQLRLVTLFLMSMVALLLLLACANVANLLLSRALARRREVAVRIAVGAGRGRLMRQLFTESLLLALIGGAAGLLVAVWARRLLWALRPPGVARLDTAFDWRVLGFALAATLLTGVVFGLAPALQTLRADLVGALKSGAVAAQSRRRFGLRELLVTGQIALSLLLLVGTGLLLRSLDRAQNSDPGFAASRLLSVSFDLPAAGYDGKRALEFCRRAVERARALPGVKSAAIGLNRPLFPGVGGLFFIEKHASPPPDRGDAFLADGVDESYFTTLGIPLQRGRVFAKTDTADSPMVFIVNQTFANRYLKDENPIGQVVHLIGSPTAGPIVGVVRDSIHQAIGETPRPFIFIPLTQYLSGETTLYIRTERDPAGTIAAARQAVQALDPNLPLLNVRTVENVIKDSLWTRRAGALILAIFGILGLTLASVGTYGVMAFTVNQRRREIGIQMALGAQRQNVLARVLRHGLFLICSGLVAGIAVALATSHLIESVLYGINPIDLPTFVLAPLGLAVTAFLAALFPARRATGVDPVKVLRTE